MKMWWRREPKKTHEYNVTIVSYDNNSVRPIVGGEIFHDRENMLSAAADLESCAAQIRGDLTMPPEKKP